MFGSPWRYAAVTLVLTAAMTLTLIIGLPRWLNILTWVIGLPLVIWSLRRVFGILNWSETDGEFHYTHHRHRNLRAPVPPQNHRDGKRP